MSNDSAAVDVVRRVDTAKAEIKPWVEPAARIGHGAKAVVFILTGFLAAAARLGFASDVDGPAAAFGALRRAPLGKVMLAMVGVGLLYCAAWELCRALGDPERAARGKVLPRVEWLIGAVVFGFLSVAAFRVVFAREAMRGDDAARTWASRIMADIPFGGVVLGLVGAVVIIAGAILIRRGWRADFERSIDMTALPPHSSTATYAIARFGIVARGVVVLMIGFFLTVAAWTHDPSEAVGIEGALRTLERQSSGPWLLGAVALGLASYGIYELLIAWKGRFYIT